MSSFRALQAKGLAAYLRAVRVTSRLHVAGAPTESAIVPLWHESLLVGLPLAAGNANVAIYVLDRLVTRSILVTLRELGLTVIAARSENGFGVDAVREWTRRPGRYVLVTLDGPDGPRRICRPGVARLARMAKVPLRPIHLSATRGYTLNTWDRGVVPEPFGALRGTFLSPIDASGPPAGAAAAVDAALGQASASDVAVRAFGIVAKPARLWVSACVTPLQFGTLTLGLHTRSPG